MDNKTKELYDAIINWEESSAESFFDYFCHDHVTDRSWAFFLLGKGFIEKANEIIDEISKGNKCIDQDTLYEIYHEYDDDDKYVPESRLKNIQVMSEFLSSTSYYYNMVTEWLRDHATDFEDSEDE